MEARIVVAGIAATAGSKRTGYDPRTNRTWIRNDSPRQGPWQRSVAQAAMEQYRGPLLDGALVLEVHFYSSRPKSHFGSGKNSTLVKSSAPYHPATGRDLDKLLRAVADPLHEIVFRNDSQIVEITAYKHYGEPARAEIVVRQHDVQTVGDIRAEPVVPGQQALPT